MAKNTLNRKILSIAWPMMLSSASVPLLGMVDTALLGHLDSERFLAAVAVGSMFIGLLFWSFGFLRMGTTGLSAQALGRRNRSETSPNLAGAGAPESDIDAILFRAIAIACALGAIVVLLTPFALEQVLDWLQAGPDIKPLASEYIEIRRLGAPAVFITMAISGFLIGCQHPRAALALVLTTNLSNIGLDIWFINGLGWESAGAAWASLIAEHFGLLVALLFAWKYSQIFRARLWAQWFKASAVIQMLLFNYHLLVRTLLLTLVFNFFTAQGASSGETILAANAILLQLVLLSAFVLDGFAYAAEALCGEAYGSGDHRRLMRTIKYCRNWIFGSALLFVIVYFIFGETILRLFTDLDPVLIQGASYLPWAILATGVGFCAYWMDGIYIGLAKSAQMHYSMWIASGIFILVWYLTRQLDNHGLWLAFCCWLIARGIVLALHMQFWRTRYLSSRQSAAS